MRYVHGINLKDVISVAYKAERIFVSLNMTEELQSLVEEAKRKILAFNSEYLMTL